jgi:hypothetical protein
MVYISRNIKNRVAIGDDCFYLEQLPDGRVKLIPAPDSVAEPGTDVNKGLLQLMVDRIVWLLNSIDSFQQGDDEMAYISREIKDRVAVGDDCFHLEHLEDGRVRLIPAPDSVVEVGTVINKDLLQWMEDKIVWLMNSINTNIAANPFAVEFKSLDGLTITGVWNESLSRIEC